MIEYYAKHSENYNGWIVVESGDYIAKRVSFVLSEEEAKKKAIEFNKDFKIGLIPKIEFSEILQCQ